MNRTVSRLITHTNHPDTCTTIHTITDKHIQGHDHLAHRRHVKMAVASAPPTGGWVTSQQPPTGSISRKKPFQGSTRQRAVSVKLLNFNSRGMWTSGGLSKRQVIGRLAGERGVDCCVLTETKTGTLGE